jgi:hypothetical protein
MRKIRVRSHRRRKSKGGSIIVKEHQRKLKGVRVQRDLFGNPIQSKFIKKSKVKWVDKLSHLSARKLSSIEIKELSKYLNKEGYYDRDALKEIQFIEEDIYKFLFEGFPHLLVYKDFNKAISEAERIIYEYFFDWGPNKTYQYLGIEEHWKGILDIESLNSAMTAGEVILPIIPDFDANNEKDLDNLNMILEGLEKTEVFQDFIDESKIKDISKKYLGEIIGLPLFKIELTEKQKLLIFKII